MDPSSIPRPSFFHQCAFHTSLFRWVLAGMEFQRVVQLVQFVLDGVIASVTVLPVGEASQQTDFRSKVSRCALAALKRKALGCAGCQVAGLRLNGQVVRIALDPVQPFTTALTAPALLAGG